MSNAVSLYQDKNVSHIDRVFASHGVQKADLGCFAREGNGMEKFNVSVIKGYFDLLVGLGKLPKLEPGDHIWAQVNSDPYDGKTTHMIFYVKAADAINFGPDTVIHRHDGLITVNDAAVSLDNLSVGNTDSIKTRDRTVTAAQLAGMPDFFFRPSFEVRASSTASLTGLLRPAFDKIGSLFGVKANSL